MPKNYSLLFNHKTGQISIVAIKNNQAFNANPLLDDTDSLDQLLSDADQIHQNSMQNSNMLNSAMSNEIIIVTD
ncbi:hypothetical protein JCM30760_00250 [Thiomicrorhabdus hydrogeniphila]